ncbi:MAG: hypothetical protein ABR524_09450, partial [Thermoanaerobaculia bacterium]
VHPMIRAIAIAIPLLLLAILLSGCGQAEVKAERWQQMGPEEKELFVKSLIGGEAAASAKGSGGKRYSRPSAEYVELLDARYREGDPRTVEQIWPELAD